MTLGEWVILFNAKYNKYLSELADVGRTTAEQGFASTGYVGDNSAVDVMTEMQDAGFRITASGEAVSFMEFGTGVATSVSPTFSGNVQAEYEIRPGSWSEEHKQQFSKNGFWYYRNEFLEGTPPAAAMQNACITMQFQSPMIARSVFQ